ncbi:Vps54-like protein-domain-containing protein [Ochromonadaceae sp. CCMP2298]|nr:Vps54-like protein-domain-containing protein [Ochromonadaceae sp. CCMP2298]
MMQPMTPDGPRNPGTGAVSLASPHRRVIMPVEEDLDVQDADNFEDIRMELQATGHNLTSVLINPRETYLENFFDEFATEQSAPLEYSSPLGYGLFGLTTSTLSSHQSSHRSAPSSAHGSGGAAAGAAAGAYSYATTPAEDAELDQLVKRLQRVFAGHQALHGHFAHTSFAANSLSPRGNSSNGNSSGMGSSKKPFSSPGSGKHRAGGGGWSKTAGDELRVCYQQVPDLFFRPDFSLKQQSIFDRTLLIKDNGEGGAGGGAGTGGAGGAGVAGGKQLSRTYSSEDIMAMARRQGMGGQQDVLSSYLDLVEVALLRQIWLRSPAFFRALDDIKGLQYQVYETTKLAGAARGRLSGADEAATALSRRIPQLHRRQRNEGLLQEKLACMQRAVQGRGAIVALLEAEDYFSATELISATRRLFSEQLSGLSCMRQLGLQLEDIDRLVCEVMCNKFVSLAIQWEEPEPTPIPAHSSSRESGGELDSGNSMGNSNTSNTSISSSIIGNSSSNNGSSSSSKAGVGGVGGAGGKLSAEVSLKQLLQSLILTQRTQAALSMYRGRLLEALKLIVRTCVTEYLHAFDPADEPMGEEGGETPFSQRVREMSGESFLSCLMMCFEHLLVSAAKAKLFHEFIESHLCSSDVLLLCTLPSADTDADRHTNTQTDADTHTDVDADKHAHGDALADAHADAQPSNGSGSNGSGSNGSGSGISDSGGGIADASGQEQGQGQGQWQGQGQGRAEEFRAAQQAVIAESRACLAAACDLAQRSIAQLISLRREANARMPPAKMRVLWERSLGFVLSLEGVSGSTAYVVRQCLLGQTKSFLEHLHETCKGRLVATLDNERWTQCDVSGERQAQVDRLSSGLSSARVDLSASASTGHSLSAMGGGAGAGGTGGGGGGVGVAVKRTKETRPAVVDGVEFKVVWSALLLTEILLTYLEVALHFSPVTPDVIAKIVELFRLFNARTRQLVLGAQAIQSAARLKSISAKHLAITAQSLGLVVSLLPHIRAALLAQIPPKHQLLLTELDRMSHEFIEHHGGVLAKLVGIVGDFVDASSSRLRQVDWDHFQGLQCAYFEEVQRNVTALHRVLLATLPPAQVQDVFSRIFALLNRKIPQHFEEVLPGTQAGCQRILDEVTHLVTAFSRLKQIDSSALTEQLEETFRKKFHR